MSGPTSIEAYVQLMLLGDTGTRVCDHDRKVLTLLLESARERPTGITSGAGIILGMHANGEIDDAGRDRLMTQHFENYVASANARDRIEIVEAPGDRCGGSRVLPNDQACPGCRACS